MFKKFFLAAIFLQGAIACGPDDLVNTPGFPEGYADLKCEYIECLRRYNKKFQYAPDDFALEKLGNAKNKAEVAFNKMMDLGDVLVSVDRMGQSMKWFQRYRQRAINKDRQDAKNYSNRMGEFGSDCTVDLLDAMIDAHELEPDFVDVKVLADASAKSEQAKAFQNDKDWKSAVFRALWGIRLILNDMGERFICTPCET